MGFIKRAWKGEEKLWKVFWLYGVVGGFLLNFVVGLAIGKGMVGFLVQLPYAIWIMVSEWRCAWNASAKFWGVIVRILVVFGVIGYILLAVMTAGLFAIFGVGGASAMGGMQACAETMAEQAKASGQEPKEYMKQHDKEMQACLAKAMGISADKFGGAAVPQAASVSAAAPVVAPVSGNAPVAPAAPTAPVAAPAAPMAGAVPVTPASGNVPAVAPAPAAYANPCEQKMAEYAIANHADPKAYITQNQAYLTQCMATLAPQPKP